MGINVEMRNKIWLIFFIVVCQSKLCAAKTVSGLLLLCPGQCYRIYNDRDGKSKWNKRLSLSDLSSGKNAK